MSNSDKASYIKKRTETQAFKASEELDEVLHDKDSGCYKPWQFANYKVNTDTLKTTYDEVILWGTQEAMIRPGWKVTSDEVTIPNLFSKVLGVHENIKKYKSEINQLIQEENTLFYKKFPIVRKRFPQNINKIYRSLLNIRGKIDKEKLITSDYWKYQKLNTVLQNAIADKIIEFLDISSFWKHRNFKIKIRMSLLNRIIEFISSFMYDSARNKRLMKVSIFSVLTNLSDELLGILQKFDYPMKVPKIIIYNNDNKKNLTFQDAIILMFMNSLGIDVIIYNPAGTSDIENYVQEENYDIHRLEDVRSKLNFRRGIF